MDSVKWRVGMIPPKPQVIVRLGSRQLTLFGVSAPKRVPRTFTKPKEPIVRILWFPLSGFRGEVFHFSTFAELLLDWGDEAGGAEFTVDGEICSFAYGKIWDSQENLHSSNALLNAVREQTLQGGFFEDDYSDLAK